MDIEYLKSFSALFISFNHYHTLMKVKKPICLMLENDSKNKIIF